MEKSGSVKKGRFSISKGKAGYNTTSTRKGRFNISKGKSGYNTSSTRKGRFNVSKGTNGFNTTPMKKSSKKSSKKLSRSLFNNSGNSSRSRTRTRTNTKSSNKYNNRLTSDENFIMTKNEMTHVKMYMKLKNKVPLTDKLKKEIKSVDRELDIVMKNKYFNPFKTSVSMVPFTRWKNDESTKPQNKIYVFTQKKYQVLMDKIRKMNKILAELLQQKINRVVIKYNKINKNAYIRSIYKKIDTLRKKLDKYNFLIPKDIDLILDNIKELNRFVNDTRRRLK